MDAYPDILSDETRVRAIIWEHWRMYVNMGAGVMGLASRIDPKVKVDPVTIDK